MYFCGTSQVAHEIICLEILTLLLENPTEDSVEVAIGFLKEAGLKLSEVSPTGTRGKQNAAELLPFSSLLM